MWEWLESLIQYGSGAAIAATALIWQQRWTDRREDLRRREERELAAAERSDRLSAAQTNREETLAERWRDQRLHAHAAVLRVVNDVVALLEDISIDMDFTDFRGEDGRTRRDAFTDLVFWKLPELLPTVTLVSSAESRARIEELRALSKRVGWEVSIAYEPRTSDGDDSAVSIHRNLEDLVAARNAYLEAARIDLGTD